MVFVDCVMNVDFMLRALQTILMTIKANNNKSIHAFQGVSSNQGSVERYAEYGLWTFVVKNYIHSFFFNLEVKLIVSDRIPQIARFTNSLRIRY